MSVINIALVPDPDANSGDDLATLGLEFVDSSINTDPDSAGNGGYALYLHQSSVVISDTDFIYGSDVTFEFLVKCDGNCSGVIMSYVKTSTFSIAYDQSLLVYQDDDVINTNRTLEADAWNLVSLVFESDTLSVYVFDSNGDALFSQLTVQPLEGFGDLAFGTWLPPKDSSHFRPEVGDFVGYVDEIRVWRTSFDSVVVQSHWNALFDANTDVGFLAALWKMDTVGFELKDELSAHELLAPIAPFTQPTIAISTAPVPPQATSLTLPFNPQDHMTSLSRRRRRSPPPNHDDATRAMTAEEVSQFCEQIFFVGPMSE